MSDSKDWVAHAERLPEGYTRKFPHNCGEGAALQVNHKEDRYTAYCHRCGFKDWQEKAPENLAEKLARIDRRRAAERVAQVSPALPMPAVYEPQQWPLAARVWLYRAGVSNADIEALGIYWNPDMERVVLPVRNEAGQVVYWQARTLLPPTLATKYKNPHVDKSNLIAKYGDGDSIVLTEDLLSAWKVSRVGVAGWCLLGTKINDYTASEIIKAGKPVYTWLDPDSAGQTAARQIVKRLRAYGVTTCSVLSERDPKLLNREQIREVLNEHRI